MEGIVVDTFGDTIDREMLSDELAAELDAKATQAALTSETTALKNRVSSLEQAMPKKGAGHLRHLYRRRDGKPVDFPWF